MKSIKIANIGKESLYILWTTWEISMKFSGKTWLMIIFKVTKKQGFTLSFKDWKNQKGGEDNNTDKTGAMFFDQK